MSSNAIVLANGVLSNIHGKVAHGLIRRGGRFRVVAVVDPDSAGRDAGDVMDGVPRGIPVTTGLSEAIAACAEKPECCVVGVAGHGGRINDEVRALIIEAAQAGLSIVSGLHDYVSDIPQVVAATQKSGASITDIRKPKPKRELRFWNGDIYSVRTPRIAVLGTDCALGKRTTSRLVTDALNADGVKTEMIYTGQTGWMQGGRYGFVLDSVYNDYVSGELEQAVVSCEREVNPDLMILEGQSSLRNPSGPCGAELLVSAGARGVILQHAPGRTFFEGYEELEPRIPPLEEEIELIRLYGARTLALTLHGESLTPDEFADTRDRLETEFDIPVVRPLEDGVNGLIPAIRTFIEEERR